MDGHSKPLDSSLLSDCDTTTPEQDSNTGTKRRKRARTKRLRKKNAVLPSFTSSPVHRSTHGLRLQPIECTGLRGKGASARFSKSKIVRTFGSGEGKMTAVSFKSSSNFAEILDGNITITSSYPSLKEAGNQEHSSDQKSSQKTQSTSLTSMSSTSPHLPDNARQYSSRSYHSMHKKGKHHQYGEHEVDNDSQTKQSSLTRSPPSRRSNLEFPTKSNSAQQKTGLQSHVAFADGLNNMIPPCNSPSAELEDLQEAGSNNSRAGFWWESYNSHLVKPLSTCLLVPEDTERCLTSPYTLIIDHFIDKYRTVSFSNTKTDALVYNENIQVDLEFIAKCLDEGVNIDQVDGAGQTVLMEAARSWHLDVVRYLIYNEASVIHQDYYGRTPIHVAAAANRPAVVHLLLDKGANPNSKVKYSGETPLHLAARRGGLLSVEALLERGAYLEACDYKGRTPFHMAAEFGQCDMVDFLLKSGADPATIDDDGVSCLTHIILNCPKLIDRALDSLVQHSEETEKPLYDPAFLETSPEEWRANVKTNFLLDVIESEDSVKAIRHTVIQTMIKTRWLMFGRLWAIMNFFFRFLFFAAWTAWILAIRWEDKHNYDWSEHWWRALLPAFGIFFLAWEIKIEILEFLYSIRRGVTMARIRLDSIEGDLKFLIHPRWKDEETHLLEEEKKTRRLTLWYRQCGLYIREVWNIYDLMIFAVIVICVITHVMDYVEHSVQRARIHGQLGSITIILLGVRLMKDIRGFFAPGQLVIMLGLMASDFGRFIFLYLQLYVPFTIAFWIIFGGVRHPYHEICQFNCSNPTANCSDNFIYCNFTTYTSTQCDIVPDSNCVTNRTDIIVSGMESYMTLCFSLFRLTLVDEYDLDTMVAIDPYMSFLLVTAFLLTSAIVGINFLIGLISNVLGDGAREHVEVKSLLQKLKVILLIEQSTYMCGPRPHLIAGQLAREQHELSYIQRFHREDTFSQRQYQRDVTRNLNKLRRMLAGVIQQQHELLVNYVHLEQLMFSNKTEIQKSSLPRCPQRPKTPLRPDLADDCNPDGVDSGEKVGFIEQPVDFRSKTSALKFKSLDLSMSYNLKARDIDAEDNNRSMSRSQQKRSPPSVRFRDLRKSRSTSRINVTN